MQKREFAREPTWTEVFDQTHKRERGTGSYVSEKARAVMLLHINYNDIYVYVI